MMKVTVLADLPYSGRVELTKEIISVLVRFGAEVFLPDETKPFLQGEPSLNFGDYEKIISMSDVIIVVGGDGTVTKYATFAARYNKPMLGINGGHLGFLSSLEKTEIELLSHIFTGEYNLKKRMLLRAEIYDENNHLLYSDYCLNDAVVGRATSIRMVDISVELNAKPLGRHRADGVIVATPTGSTAYSMSAGGPVVYPHMECLIVTPICSHSLTARSVVCLSESCITLKNASESADVRPLFLVTDSKEPVEVPFGGRVEVKRAEIQAEFITIKPQNFYEILQEKMIDRNIDRG